MSVLDLNALNALPKVERILALAETNAQLEKLDAEGRVAWALENLPGNYVLSSSFGIQAAVSLHLVNQIRPDIPVILTDTGYLFPETYQFIDELTDKLKLNLKVYRAAESAAWQEARYGKLWEQGVEGIEKYNEINKVEPMNRALKELNAQTWFAGLRREQSGSRATLPVLAVQRGVFKVLPIIDWDNRTVYQYLQKHGLKYHPLWDQGYLSVGDTHTTRKWEPGMAEEETRFFGLKKEKLYVQLMILFVISLIGEGISSFFHLPIPGSIIGLIILFLALQFKWLRTRHVNMVGNFLLANMTILFLPPAVGIMEKFDVIAPYLLPIVLIVFFAAVINIILIALVVQFIKKRYEGDYEERGAK